MVPREVSDKSDYYLESLVTEAIAGPMLPGSGRPGFWPLVHLVAKEVFAFEKYGNIAQLGVWPVSAV